MFSSRNRHNYQVIDDDYEEPDVRISGGFGLNRFGRVQNALGTESSPLIEEGSSVSMRRDPEEHSGPLLTTSSAEERPNWDHITDLDDFFRQVYEYHQGGGFKCLFWSGVLSLIQFLFIVFISTFFLQCIDYDILFNNKAVNSTDPLPRKRYFTDAVVSNCHSQLNPWIIACILVATVYWIFRVIRTAVQLLKLKEIQRFYNVALSIDDADLVNLTWEAVVKAICNAQNRINLLVHDSSISAIHVYHRILRFKNYLVAMISQDRLPTLISIPFLGECRYLPEQLKKNVDWMFFLGFCSPFKGSHTLQDEYRDRMRLEDMAENMERVALYLGLANLAFAPLIFLYQCFYYVFTAADITKRDSGALGSRAYTTYGRFRVRHLNELDHELKSRLNRSYGFASAYVAQFNSKLTVVFARKISFIAAAIFAPLTVLSVWDEDVLQIEHVLTVLTACGVIALVCRSIIPDENLVYQPETLLDQISSELHYLPDWWKGNAHDVKVMTEFESLFRLRAFNLLEEMSSPIVTPFVLLFYIRPACRTLLSFMAQNTERVSGLGDVCSFALLDVAKNGDPTWQADVATERGHAQPAGESGGGKTELSSVQFAIRHPDWKPPLATSKFIQTFKKKMENDAMAVRQGNVRRNAFTESIHTILTMPLATPLMHPLVGGAVGAYPLGPEERGPTAATTSLIDESLRLSGHTESFVDSIREQEGAEMRVSSLYLRGLRTADKKRKVYSSMGPADASMFSVPLMEVTVAAMPRSSMGYGNDDREERPEGAMRRVVEEDEDEEDDDELPPDTFPL